MAPRLIAISGPVKGAVFELTENEVSLGRDSSNAVHLNDLSVSRRHCLIRRQSAHHAEELAAGEETSNEPGAPSMTDSEFTLLDLESYNGTFVNGVPVHEQKLAHGDQIALGDIVLLFLLHEPEPGTTPPEQVGESDLITRSTVRLRREDALYLHPEKLAADVPRSDRLARDLSTLLRISSSIGALRTVSELRAYLLETIREITPAERIVVALAGQNGDELTSTTGWSLLKGADDSIKPSRAITSQVQRERVALLSNDIVQNEGLAHRPSLVEANVCSVVCVPLVVFDEALGVIYLDTSNRSSRFDEDELQLLTGIAGIAAVAFENARNVESLQHENERLHQEIKLEHQLIGESEPLRAVLQLIGRVAPTDSTVLIRGESGTGKELAARAIHINSTRATKPFVAINCATLTETLIETELFGHEKGAFTGAIALKRGKLEIADGGTVFLDEVAELTPLIQGKLLRVLQEREFERLGGNRPIKVDVRIITATNQNLEQAIKDKKFREDLYYRLNVVSVVMPALRERREDIPLLANYFLLIYSKKCKRKVRGLADETRRLLQQYDWPGNVRELENAIERAVVLGTDDLITADDLPERLMEAAPSESAMIGYHQAVTEAKKELVIKAVRQANGNYTQAAKALGIHPNNLHRLIKTLNVKSAI
jgi:transcriptional regulator with GAF, ATPase, and Fis domain/pSer/pThr/pTyr-binding forkhead associated (FHA) protein